MRARLVAFGFGVMLASCSLITDSDGLVGKSPTNGAQPDAAPVSDAGDKTDGTSPPADAGADADAASESPYRALVLADGPAFYFPFDEPAGSSFATDAIANTQAVAFDQVVFGVAGAVGNAVSFDGNSHMECGDIFDLPGNAPFSIELWIKTTGEGEILNKRLYGDAGFDGLVLYMMKVPAEEVRLEIWSPGGNRGGWGTIKSGEFSHVVFTFDGKSTLSEYVDGLAVSSTYTSTSDTSDNDKPLMIAVGGFAGVIDELALYDKPISITRVRAHYDARAAKK